MTCDQSPPLHLSAYQLTVEPGTPLYHAVRRKEIRLPDEDMMADMFEASIAV